ncbi:MAG: GTP cyclohydrolase FolE2 [Candidatus Cloacimonetes bacterium]|nr:GTP cyclohydrolase FolE2 [Candidatus Cloacimonadota bacterium]
MSDVKDIQNSHDKRRIPIQRVGVKDIRYPIVVEDRENGEQHTIAEMDIYVNLPHHHRGTHMSRFIKVLNDYHETTFIHKLHEFLESIRRELDADSAYTRISFPYFIRKAAPVSGIKSLMSYECSFEAALEKDFSLTLGVKVPVMSLCPCSKEISKYGAHNQRSYINIEVCMDDFIWLEELIRYAEDSASSELYSLLKRVDEKHVTEVSYENPKFVEDIVRDLAIKLRKDSRISWFRIESVNMESIHNHSAYACIEWQKNN